MRTIHTSLAALVLVASLHAQNEGDVLFDVDQVITVEFTFAQPNYWDSLVANYTTETYMWAGLTITDQSGTYAFDSVGVRLKGNSSYSHPNDKKSMKVDINEYVSGQNYHGLKKLNLNNGFKDPTFLREKIFMDYSREMDVLAPRINFANVYMNGQLKGFFTVAEQVDDQFLDRWIGDDQGNLFSAGDNFGGGTGSEADLKYYGPDQADYYDRYELKTNEGANDWSDLLDLTEMIDDATDAYLVAQLPGRWDWERLCRSLALDNIFANLDSYINSSRNYYIYHNSTTGDWQWIKWDANEAFGQYSGGVSNVIQLAPTYGAANRPLIQRMMALPALQQDHHVQYCQALELLTNDQLDHKIDALKAIIQASVYADPNKMYTNAQFDQNIESNINLGGGGGGGISYGLKSFITQRRSYLEGVLDCSLYTSVTGPEWNGTLPTAYPNPAMDVLGFKSTETSSAWQVEVLDLAGRRVLEQQGLGTMDISGLVPGTYVVRTMAEGRSGQQLIVKQ